MTSLGPSGPSAPRPPVVVVVTGGPPLQPVPDPPVLTAGPGELPDGAYVIAADSGLDQARALGWPVDLVVGDLDSASAAALEATRAEGTPVDAHPEAKDQTDLELALDRALALGPDRIVVVGSGGGRLDHLLAGVLALAADRYASVAVEAWLDGTRVTVVRGQATLRGEPGSLVSLVPVGGPACGITLAGLRYPLDDEDLAAGVSRGVSNEMVGTEARVALRSGVLLAVQPPLVDGPAGA